MVSNDDNTKEFTGMSADYSNIGNDGEIALGVILAVTVILIICGAIDIYKGKM